MLLALEMYLGPTPEIVLLGNLANADTVAVVDKLRQNFIPNKVVALRLPSAPGQSKSLDPIFAGKSASPNEPTLFVCENFSCQAPAAGRQSALAHVETLVRAE